LVFIEEDLMGDIIDVKNVSRYSVNGYIVETLRDETKFTLTEREK